MTPEQCTLEDYRTFLAAHDWTYEYSEDQNVWRSGKARREFLKLVQARLDPDGVIWNKYAPSDMQIKVESTPAARPAHEAVAGQALAQMWEGAEMDWNLQVGALPDVWEHFATRLNAALAARPKPAPAAGDEELPPLPKPVRLMENDDYLICGFTQDQMETYARAAIAADRAARSQSLEQERKPLSEWDVSVLVASHPRERELVRAVEAAHGITAKAGEGDQK